MAYIIPNPNQTNTAPFTPTGNKPSNAISFSLPFNGSAVFNPVYSNREALKANLINWFLTNKGERILNPNFGANLRAYIFEALNDNSFEALEMKIQDDIENNFPMVNIQDLQVFGSEEYNRVKIILTYFSLDSNNPDTVDLTFQ